MVSKVAAVSCDKSLAKCSSLCKRELESWPRRPGARRVARPVAGSSLRLECFVNRCGWWERHFAKAHGLGWDAAVGVVLGLLGEDREALGITQNSRPGSSE